MYQHSFSVVVVFLRWAWLGVLEWLPWMEAHLVVCFNTSSKNDVSQDSILQMAVQLICVQKYIELHIETRLYTLPDNTDEGNGTSSRREPSRSCSGQSTTWPRAMLQRCVIRNVAEANTQSFSISTLL